MTHVPRKAGTRCVHLRTVRYIFCADARALQARGIQVRYRLKRWLLKMCFNSARIHDAADVFVFRALLPYINGQSDAEGRYVQLYLQLAYPIQVPAEDFSNTPQMWWPADHRVGHLWFTAPEGQKLLRAVMRAFSTISATTPATCGVALLVPLAPTQPSFLAVSSLSGKAWPPRLLSISQFGGHGIVM
jgi:hypothetical protein